MSGLSVKRVLQENGPAAHLEVYRFIHLVGL